MEVLLCIVFGIIHTLINWFVFNISETSDYFLLRLCLRGFTMIATSILLYRIISYMSREYKFAIKIILLATAYIVAVVTLHLLFKHKAQQLMNTIYRPNAYWWWDIRFFSLLVYASLMFSPLLSALFDKFKEALDTIF
ncbi:MAG: hypothetical protein FWG87_05765 [Defluviitaleaceae bacterium]|nr:hypothetical protein [Defluviitaleaceae bacterium]